MKKVFAVLIFGLLVLSLGLHSCAVDPEEDSSDYYNRALEAWIRVHYGTALAPDDSGVYMVTFDQGTGDMPGDTSFVTVTYIRRELDGNVLGTNDEDLCKRLDTWKATGYYGGATWQLGTATLPYAVENTLKKMRVGGHAMLVAPLSQTTVPYSAYSEFPSSEGNNILYELWLTDVKDDIYAWQDEMMAEHSRRYYDGMDTTAAGFYFKYEGTKEKRDTIYDERAMTVWYIGRRLDGTVFDTNIKDTARFYRLSGGSYSALSITYYDDVTTMLTQNSSYVAGFIDALHLMRFGDTCTTFFRSDLGYGASGKLPSIPEYSPLKFTLFVEGE